MPHLLVSDEVERPVAPRAVGAVGVVEALTGVQHRVAARVDGRGALEAPAHLDRRFGLLAGGQVEPVDLALEHGIDDLDEAVVVDELVGQTHRDLRLARPLHQQRLSRPPGARPVRALTTDLADALGPQDAELLLGDGGRPVRAAGAVVVATERQDAGNLVVLVGLAEHHLLAGGVGDRDAVGVHHRPGEGALGVGERPGVGGAALGRLGPVRERTQTDRRRLPRRGRRSGRAGGLVRTLPDLNGPRRAGRQAQRRRERDPRGDHAPGLHHVRLLDRVTLAPSLPARLLPPRPRNGLRCRAGWPGAPVPATQGFAVQGILPGETLGKIAEMRLSLVAHRPNAGPEAKESPSCSTPWTPFSPTPPPACAWLRVRVVRPDEVFSAALSRMTAPWLTPSPLQRILATPHCA